jgi:hypothetical protein
METKVSDRPASWGETFLALGPVLLFTVLFALILILSSLLNDLSGPAFGLGVQFTVAGLVLAALFVGWVKGFPRWVFPYWGFALLITVYLYGFSGTISGYPFHGDWRTWIPVAAIVLLGTLWTRSLRPIYTLFKSVWKDWTLLSFAFYGALPLLFFAAYEEVHNGGLARTLITLLLSLGVIFYMRVEVAWHRFASLVGGFTIGWLALMIHLSLYWNGRQLFWMPEPGSWVETLNWTSQMGAVLMLILVAPVLVEFLRRIARSVRQPKATG